MANSLLDTPTICPVSLPSNNPARNEIHRVLGSIINRDRGSNPVETVYSSVPDFGPDIEIDEGSPVVTYK